MMLGTFCSAVGERWEERSLYPCFLKIRKIEKIFPSTSYWWGDGNIKRCTGLGNHHPEQEKQKEKLQLLGSKNHRILMLMLHQQQQNKECIVLPTFIIQSSEVMQQSNCCHTNSARKASIAQPLSGYLSCFSGVTVLGYVVSSLLPKYKYLMVIQLLEVASFCQKINGMLLLSFPTKPGRFFFSLEKDFLK